MYHSHIFANNDIEVAGFCRGGRLYSLGNIAAGELGSDTGVKTKVEIEENGKIAINKIHPEVTINVGMYTHKFNAREHKVKFTKEGMTALL